MMLSVTFALGFAVQAASVEVRSVCEPAEAAIGQPVTCILTVVHPADTLVSLERDELALDDSWVAEGERRLVGAADPADPARRVTRVAWTLRSLEAGERALVVPAVRIHRDGAPRVIDAPPALLVVLPALSEGEDEARPAAGFRPAPAWDRPLSGSLARLAGLALLLGTSAVFFFRRARRTSVAAGVPSPAERLAALGEHSGEFEGSAELHYELTALVREAVDESEGIERRAATDEEWLAALGESEAVDGETRLRLAELLAECARVKYGQERPTRWAVETTLETARDLVASLDASPEVES